MAAISKVLIVGGGIAGLCLASALRDADIDVDIVELKREWTVYGVGIIQQCNVVRAMAQLGLLQGYVEAGFPFEEVKIADGDFNIRAVIPGHRLAGPLYPANMGISRLALHDVLSRTAVEKGTHVRLGLTVTGISQGPDTASVAFSDGSTGSYDLVVGADGIASKVRALVFGEHHVPRYTGQGVWRYNFRRRPEVNCLIATNGPNRNAGLVPLSDTLMYLYVTSEEAPNQRFPADQLHHLMRERMLPFGGLIGELRDEIIDPAGVVYRPIETIFVDEPWHRGRVVLIGDAAHSTTPHLGQGAGMAIEDAVVLSHELVEAPDLPTALTGFMARRFERCRFICESSEEICAAELARSATLDRIGIVRRMLERTAEPV